MADEVPQDERRRDGDAAPARPYVGDVGKPVEGVGAKGALGFGMVLLSIAVGFVIGFLVWGVFRLSTALTNLLWGGLGTAVGDAPVLAALLPLIVCAVGGLIIGLWTTFVGGEPRSLEEVMGQVKRTGGYRVDGAGKSVVGFLLPIVFGGSIGPEAGLTGLIAAACTWIGRTLRSAGLRAKAIADVTVSAALAAIFATPLVGIVATAQDAMPRDRAATANKADGGAASDEGRAAADPADYDFRRWAKIVLYAASAFGACAGIVCLGMLAGPSGGLPHFDGIVLQPGLLWWAIPCIAFGYVLALLFHAGSRAFARLGSAFGRHTVIKPVVAGVVLGAVALALPDVLFSGEAQSREIMESWQASGAVVLAATAVAKALLTPLCLNLGWRGGSFFPCIFAGISGGYAIAVASGVDPMFCVAMVTAATVAGMMRKALPALALLLLCVPVDSLVWMGLACILGATLPMPRALFRQSSKPSAADADAAGDSAASDSAAEGPAARM